MTAIRPGAVARPADGDTLPRVIVALLVATVGVDLLYLIDLLVPAGAGSDAGNVVLSLATQWVPVSVFWLVAAGMRFRCPSVVLAALGVTLSALGDTYYSLAMDADGYLPFPSPADAGYLLFYPLMVAGLVVLVRRPLAGLGRLMLLETTVATLGAAAILAVVLGPVIDGAIDDGDPLGSAIAVAYPLFDVLLLAVIAGIASVLTTSVGRRSWSLLVGLGVFAAADVAYAVLESQGAYLAGTPLDATWAVGLAFIAWWVAGVPADATESAGIASRRTRIALPALAVIAGFIVLLAGLALPVPMLAQVLAAATIGLATVPLVFRQAMLGRMLADQEEAVRRLTELDQEKAELLATVNHEFRTPLTSVNGHVELLLDGGAGELPPAAVAMLRTVERNGARLAELIEETFAASPPDRGGATTARRSVALAGLTSGAAGEVAPLADRRGVRLTVRPGDVEPVVDADPDELHSALVNLVDNAVKFTSAGGRVDVDVERDGGEAVVRIADTGIGIPESDRDRLFTRFFRASNVQRGTVPGVGLGLSIAHRIVTEHGGSIQVESEPGTGTTITVRLPADVTA